MGVPPTVLEDRHLVDVVVRVTVLVRRGPAGPETPERSLRLLPGGRGHRPGPSRSRTWCPSRSCGSTRALPVPSRRSRPRPGGLGARAPSESRSRPRSWSRSSERSARQRLEGRLGDAATAFAGERFGEARQLLAPIVQEVPELAEGRELYGLTLYRLGRWKEAARELDAFVELSGGSTEQHPVLADCRRALRQYREVDRLWEELRESSPSGALVTEGRIVTAGSLADRGDLAAALFDCSRRDSGSRSARWITTCGVPMRWQTCTSAPATCPRRDRCSTRSRRPILASWMQRSELQRCGDHRPVTRRSLIAPARPVPVRFGMLRRWTGSRRPAQRRTPRRSAGPRGPR